MRQQPKTVSALVLLWLWSYTTLLHAATGPLGPFSADVQGYDLESLLYAAAMGLLGGFGRTIFALASDKVLVGSLWREGAKDGIIAVFGGAVAFVLVTYLANFWPNIFTREARMILIVAAGASRGKWVNLVGDVISAGLANMRKRIGGEMPRDPPPSAAVPLEEPPK